MIIYRNPTHRLNIANPIVTVGSFDGVHHGHRTIIDSLNQEAYRRDGNSVIVTFNPHPRAVLDSGNTNLRLLNSLEEKEHLLSKAGIDYLIELNFTKEFSQLSSEEFIKKVIVDLVGASHMHIGYNHQFGRDRASFENLVQLAQKYGFTVEQLSKQELEGEKVSSTVIRNALLSGNIKAANKLLCHPYFFLSELNSAGELIQEEPLKLIPPEGIYKGLIEIDDEPQSVSIEINSAAIISIKSNNNLLPHTNKKQLIKFI